MELMGRIERRIKGLKVSMGRRRKKREEEIHVKSQCLVYKRSSMMFA